MSISLVRWPTGQTHLSKWYKPLRTNDFRSCLGASGRAPGATEPAPVPAKDSNDAGPSPESASSRRLPVALIFAAVIAVVVASTGIVIWKPWTQSPQTGALGATATNQQAINTGPLTGFYTAGFGPELQLSDRKVLNPEPARGAFEIRSTCTPNGCVAVANVVDGPTINRKLIFDDVGSEWISVDTVPSASPAVSAGMHAGCEQGLSPETWETLIIRPTPNGDFTGQYEVFNANNCNTTRTIYLKRTGDVDITPMEDPAQLPARVVSPAENWRGRYRYTYSSQRGAHDVEGLVRTDCLRSGERCMSYFSEPNSAEPFVFADGRWTLHYEGPVSCGSADGPRVRINRNAELELPTPVTTPINLLEGRGQEEVPPGPCGSIPLSPYSLRFERTGD